MGNHVRNTADAARDRVETFSEEKKEKIRLLADAIVNIQRKITKAIKLSGVDKDCERCDGDCCSARHENNIFDLYYFVMVLVAFSDDVRREIMETAGCLSFSPRCMYLDTDGCRIDENHRPYLCKIWFCGAKKEMRDIEERYHAEFYDLYFRLKRLVDDKEEISLHNVSCAN